MDAKDREVLAATISVDADILLTQNTKHFPRMWMTERGIELLNAGELLTRLAEHFPEKTPAAHQQAVRTSRTPEAEIPCAHGRPRRGRYLPSLLATRPLGWLRRASRPTPDRLSTRAGAAGQRGLREPRGAVRPHVSG